MKRLIVALVLACAAIAAHADGGRLQMRQAAGPFVVSLFTTPESLGVGQADLSAMIEEQGGSKVLLDADVVITLTPEDGEANLSSRISRMRMRRTGCSRMRSSSCRMPVDGTPSFR